MPTLRLTPRFTEDSQALWLAAIQLGWSVERLTSWRVPEDLRNTSDTVLYVDGLFGPTLAEQFRIQICEPPEDWLPQLPDEYRKRWVYITSLGQARGLREPAFVKPPNNKSFAAKVYCGSDLPIEDSDDLSVLVAEVVHWEKEFRCFILDREVHTLSVYLREGELQRAYSFAHSAEEEAEALEFARSVLEDSRVELPRGTVLDIGVIRGRGWAVVEQNAAWGSGIYGCAPTRVLDVLRAAMVSS